MGDTNGERILNMAFSKVYPLYIQKAEKKGRTKDEVDAVIRWLTGYDEAGLRSQIGKNATFGAFFADAPRINPDADKIKGVICGVRIEEIGDPAVQNARRLDKLVDELAKGKAMDKILRS